MRGRGRVPPGSGGADEPVPAAAPRRDRRRRRGEQLWPHLDRPQVHVGPVGLDDRGQVVEELGVVVVVGGFIPSSAGRGADGTPRGRRAVFVGGGAAAAAAAPPPTSGAAAPAPVVVAAAAPVAEPAPRGEPVRELRPGQGSKPVRGEVALEREGRVEPPAGSRLSVPLLLRESRERKPEDVEAKRANQQARPIEALLPSGALQVAAPAVEVVEPVDVYTG